MTLNPLYEPISLRLCILYIEIWTEASHCNIILNPFRIKQNIIMTFSACI